MRSATPSELGSVANGSQSELLRSPLSKRKKLAADRSGASKLKQGITALEIDTASDGEDDMMPSAALLKDMVDDGEEEDDEDSSDEEDDGPDDDFLAREFGEDWG